MTHERLSSDNRCTETNGIESGSLFCLTKQPSYLLHYIKYSGY